MTHVTSNNVCRWVVKPNMEPSCATIPPEHTHAHISKSWRWLRTQALVEPLADPGQDSQGYKVTKTGSNGGSYIVGVNARLLWAHDNAHHNETWQEHRKKCNPVTNTGQVQFYCVSVTIVNMFYSCAASPDSCWSNRTLRIPLFYTPQT